MIKVIRWSVLIPLSIVCISFIVLGFTDSVILVERMDILTKAILKEIGWMFQLITVIILITCIYIGFSKYGSIRLGGKDAKPILKYSSWIMITLCSGVAIGIVIWGVAEPLWHFRSPPEFLGIEGGTELAAVFSMSQVFIEWTLTPYSLYCFYGLFIAVAIHNAKLPDRIGSIFKPIFGKRTDTWVGDIIDTVCTIAIIGGVATNFGQGILMLNRGLATLIPIPTNALVIAIISIGFIILVLISNLSGISKGLSKVSKANSCFYLFLILFVLIFSNRAFIGNLSVQSLGYYLSNFFEQSFYTSPVNGSTWAVDWPMYYWAVWFSYAPLLGMFFAKISYGRTIKEFVSVNLLIMAFIGFIWFSIFGGASIFFDIQNRSIISAIESAGFESAVFAFFTNMPFTSAMNFIFCIVIILSLVTLLDSMVNSVSYVTVKNTSGTITAPIPIRIFWAITIGLVTMLSLIGAAKSDLNNAINLTKRIGTLAGIPVLFLTILLFYSGFKILKEQFIIYKDE